MCVRKNNVNVCYTWHISLILLMQIESLMQYMYAHVRMYVDIPSKGDKYVRDKAISISGGAFF